MVSSVSSVSDEGAEHDRVGTANDATDEGDRAGQHQDNSESDATPAEAENRAPPNIPLVPPEDCIAITEDRGVLKKVLEAGDPDSKPSLHARCLIHYVGYLASNGEQFMDTRKDKEQEEPAVVVAGRTSSAQETGLCLAAATMCKGERALVYIQKPSYGYGAIGSFSFPCVPPNSQLVYELEMVNWESIDEADNDNNRVSLLFEERLERAERRRLAGNQIFMEGRHKEALAKYALALSYMDEDFMFQLEGHYLDDAEKVKLRIHLNMAAAQLKTGDYNTATYNCGQVLQIDKTNVKALYRRGKARHKLGQTDQALQDLEAAKKLDPADKEIRLELAAVRATMQQEKKATDKLYRGTFKPTSNAKAASDADPVSTSNAKQETKGTSGGSGAAAASSQAAKRGSATGAGKAAPGGGAKGQAGGPAAPKKASKPTPAGIGLLTNQVWGLLVWLLSLLRSLLRLPLPWGQRRPPVGGQRACGK